MLISSNFASQIRWSIFALGPQMYQVAPGSEDKSAKKECLLKRAQAEAEGKTVEVKKSIFVKYGLNHVTYLIERVA